MSQTQALTLSQRAQAIDKISEAAMAAFESAESFEKELAVAKAILDMRDELTPEVMQPIMGLMNTSLGFRTDRDPNNPPMKDGKPQPVEPYSVEVVRECFIESRLRGFHSVGNEWNIIAGRWYGCKNGFERKVRSHPRVSDLKDTYEPPRLASEKGAIVKCRCDWKQDGTWQSLEREFPVRINAGMGGDAILGKAARKLFAAVLARLTGKVTPEGEAGDDPIVEVKAMQTNVVDASEIFKGKSASQAATAPAQAGSAPAKEPEKPASAAAEPARADNVQTKLAKLVAGAGFTIADFRAWSKANGRPDFVSFDDVPEDAATRLLNAQQGLLKGLAQHKK